MPHAATSMIAAKSSTPLSAGSLPSTSKPAAQRTTFATATNVAVAAAATSARGCSPLSSGLSFARSCALRSSLDRRVGRGRQTPARTAGSPATADGSEIERLRLRRPIGLRSTTGSVARLAERDADRLSPRHAGRRPRRSRARQRRAAPRRRRLSRRSPRRSRRSRTMGAPPRSPRSGRGRVRRPACRASSASRARGRRRCSRRPRCERRRSGSACASRGRRSARRLPARARRRRSRRPGRRARRRRRPAVRGRAGR